MERENEKIVIRDIEDEMRGAYVDYAMSVIVSRALPDARDGLKPSQRRILVAMHDLGLRPGSKHRKCAKIAGDTSGNYHPHGEGVIYPTLVRLAQDFIMRYALVDGQGNFGSIDGDPPAAMRYTEARMSPFAVLLMEDMEKETVDFVANYDETLQEPTVLPGKFPNLLCNGCSGIAVGMATNIPPHNLREVARAISLYIDKPDVSVAELMKVIPGPDFPTGGEVCGLEGIRQAYATGRGLIKLRARVGTEPLRGGRDSVIITEVPYGVNKANLIEKIADLVQSKRLEGISDLRDESDKEGVRVVLDLKKGEIPRVVISRLFKFSQLEVTYGIILLALDRKQPKVLPLKELMRCYVEHRKEVLIRRTRFELAKAEARAHILEGFKIALAHIEEIIRIIRKAKNRAAAQESLMKRFRFSEAQVKAILEMRLYQLTSLEKEKVEAEYMELVERIAYLKSLLASEEKILALIKEDLAAMAAKHGDERRTEIREAEGEILIEDMIREELCMIPVSHAGYIKRVPTSSYRVQRRGGKGVYGMGTKEEDYVEHLFTASTHDYILFLTERGRLHWLKVYEIPQGGRLAKGKAIVNLLELSSEEKIAAMIGVKEFDEKRHLVMTTARGIVKKTPLAAFSNPRKGGIIAIGVEEGDRLIVARLTDGGDVLLVTRRGLSIRFPEGRLRPMGRSARGVKGINLRDGDEVVAMEIVDGGGTLLVVTENGYGKRTQFEEYRKQGRGGKGIIAIKTSERNGPVVGAVRVADEDDIMMITSSGKMVRTTVEEISVIGRNTQGVRLIRLDDEDLLVAVTRTVAGEEASEET